VKSDILRSQALRWSAGLGLLLRLAVPVRAIAQTIRTDQNAYAPGNTVSIFGAGWLPGETVNLGVSEAPATDPDASIAATADANGNFENEG
jgi:hypothetical protein